MILLRMEGIQGGCEIKGGTEIVGKYEYHKAGWFPIESVNFGFESKSESQVGTQQSGSGQTQGGPDSGQASSGVSAPPIGGSNQSTEDPSAKISVGKFVDVATTVLLKFAMEDRTKTKTLKEDQGEKVRVADIHFLTSVSSTSISKTKDMKSRFVVPYLLIHLENVLVKNWNLTAQGDDRPQETLELWYDKSAMKYFSTTDGAVWIQGGITSGWDQSANKEWTAPNTEYFEDPKFA